MSSRASLCLAALLLGSCHQGLRLRYQTRPRADLIRRGFPARRLVRLFVPLDRCDVPFTDPPDRRRWTLRHNGAVVQLGYRMLLLPDLADKRRAALGVWLIERGAPGDRFTLARTGGRCHHALQVGPRRRFLGRVEVLPVVVRGTRGRRAGSDLREALKPHERYLEGSCNLQLVVRRAKSVFVPGFDALDLEQAFPDLPLLHTTRVPGPAGAEPRISLVSSSLRRLVDVLHDLRGGDEGLVIAAVFRRIRPHPAFAISPIGYHAYSERFVIRTPIYSVDPGRLLDRTARPKRLLQVPRAEDTERYYACYFEDGSVSHAFSHELGHLLGLPHRGESLLLKVTQGPNGECNLMENNAFSGCRDTEAPHLSDMQCEMMLSGLSGFVRPVPPPRPSGTLGGSRYIY